MPNPPSNAYAHAQHRARLAGFSRLLASAVNEHILGARTVTVDAVGGDVAHVAVWCIVSCSAGKKLHEGEEKKLLVGLKHAPIRTTGANAQQDVVAYIHPQDVSDHIYDILPCYNLPNNAQITPQGHCEQQRSKVAIRFADKCSTVAEYYLSPSQLDVTSLLSFIASASPHPVDNATVAQLQAELASSVHHATHAFLTSPITPKIALSSAIEWEQSIVEGHATHPMHKARFAVAPVEPITDKDADDLKRPRITFVAVKKDEIFIRGDYEAYSSRFIPKEKVPEPYQREKGWEILPVHPRQIPNIRMMFPTAVVLEDVSINALAQASLRTVVPVDQSPVKVHLPNGGVAEETIAVKLGLGVKVTSALRTVTPKTCYQGPGLGSIFAKLEVMVPDNRLIIWPEIASAWSKHEDEDIAKHLSCVVRLERVPEGETVIIAAALVEQDPTTGTSRCEAAFHLSSQKQRERFLYVYARELFGAFLPAILKAGFAFEAHPQNTLVRVRPRQHDAYALSDDWECAGFAVRDFGGIKVHEPTMMAAIGESLDVLPDSCTVADSMKDVHKLAYHTLIYCHLQGLVRALRLHHSGIGWALVRKAFQEQCSEDSALHTLWMQQHWVEMKSFMRMKLDGLYRDYLYDPSPNMLLYPGEAHVKEHLWGVDA